MPSESMISTIKKSSLIFSKKVIRKLEISETISQEISQTPLMIQDLICLVDHSLSCLKQNCNSFVNVQIWNKVLLLVQNIFRIQCDRLSESYCNQDKYDKDLNVQQSLLKLLFSLQSDIIYLSTSLTQVISSLSINQQKQNVTVMRSKIILLRYLRVLRNERLPRLYIRTRKALEKRMLNTIHLIIHLDSNNIYPTLAQRNSSPSKFKSILKSCRKLTTKFLYSIYLDSSCVSVKPVDKITMSTSQDFRPSIGQVDTVVHPDIPKGLRLLLNKLLTPVLSEISNLLSSSQQPQLMISVMMLPCLAVIFEYIVLNNIWSSDGKESDLNFLQNWIKEEVFKYFQPSHELSPSIENIDVDQLCQPFHKMIKTIENIKQTTNTFPSTKNQIGNFDINYEWLKLL